jgi:hypothetical protein
MHGCCTFWSISERFSRANYKPQKAANLLIGPCNFWQKRWFNTNTLAGDFWVTAYGSTLDGCSEKAKFARSLKYWSCPGSNRKNRARV